MPRNMLLALAALALLAALPAAPAPPAVAASSCAQDAGTFELAAPAPAEMPALPPWLAGAQPAQTAVFHGYCACECSRIKDCNTNADCSNHRCLKGISCC